MPSSNDPRLESGAITELPHKIIDTAVLSAALVETVNEICDQAADRDHGDLVGIRLHGSTTMVPDLPWPGDVDVHLVSRWERALRRVERLDALTVGVADGCCHGAAVELLLVTDHRIAARNLRLWVGDQPGRAWPGMTTYRLVNQLGHARASRLVHFGAQLTAEEALRLGLISEVVEDPQAKLWSLRQLLGPIPGHELAIRRQLLSDAISTSFEEALGAHLAACDRALRRRSDAIEDVMT